MHNQRGEMMPAKKILTKFMELAVSQDANGKISEWYQAHEYIREMERKLEEQKKQIQEYQTCFALIGKFIPKHSSIHTIIG